MRKREEIQRAHDVLIDIVTGQSEVRYGFSDQEMIELQRQADVLCWCLSHENNNFSHVMARVERLLDKYGISYLPMNMDN